MNQKPVISFLTGLSLLFFIYHFPEFFSAFWIMAVFKIGFLAIAFFLARAQGWKGLNGYGLGFTGKWVFHLIWGIITGLLFFTLSVYLSVQLGYEQLLAIEPASVILKQLPFILLITIFPSVAEDILTRGYLYAHLRFMKPYIWIALSSIFFVLNHIWRLNNGAAVLTYLFILGLVLAIAVWDTKYLWLAFGIHWGSNIAFETTNAFVHTKKIVTHDGSTWALAASWTILLVLYISLRLKKWLARPILN